LDTDSVDRFAIGAGLGRGGNLLWRLAALAPDVIALERLHPQLPWLRAVNRELTFEQLQTNAEAPFKFVGPILELMEVQLMALILAGIPEASQREFRKQLIGADPGPLRTFSVPIQRGQGVLRFGSFVDADGNRATVATQVEGILAATVDSDFPDPADGHSFNGLIAIYTSGRFIWPAVREANPAFVFDPIAINTLKAKGITFEATFSGVPEPWIRES
jgi:hypothetical protein